MTRLYACLLLPLLLILIAGCSSGSRPDPRLERAAALAADSPRKALAILDSVCRDSLSPSDRHRYNFLKVKASDKAFIDHTSDSLILAVLSYADTHRDIIPYGEVLYYGGRVYSDLGDYPTALSYFHKALEEFPPSTPNQVQRATILSQTGRLLNVLRLYEPAIENILEAIEIDSVIGDSVREVINLHLLAHTYTYSGKYENASEVFKTAFSKSRNMDSRVRNRLLPTLAYNHYRQGDIDSAHHYLSLALANVDTLSLTTTLAYAATIYKELGMRDSAYYFADKLIHLPNSLNRSDGYFLLLSPDLFPMVPNDSVAAYIHAHKVELERIFDENANQLAIIQQAQYNYSLHERRRNEADHQKQLYLKWLSFSIIVILFLFAIFSTQRYKYWRSKIQLREALDNIENLKIKLAESLASTENDDEEAAADENSVVLLRENLRKQFLTLHDNHDRVSLQLSPDISASEAYKELLKKIGDGSILPDSDGLWTELEKVVLRSFPSFRENLSLLSDARITESDYHTALLIKCHISPSQMAILFGRSKGTIVSRRDTLSIKLFGEK
ncbi:MAG: tetratricopeptide repeat protein, partial [Duncaniella sp.]|nr:tetratricopeptide repeat protein [Duncaniella sp.]